MVDVTVDALVDLATTVFVLSTMLAMGLELSAGQLRRALGRRGLMARSLLANLVLVPLVAYALVLAVPMETGYAVGILLLAVAPGAPFGPKLAEISDSDLAYASGLMAVLGIVSVVTIPVTMALLMPGGVSVDPLGIAQLVVAVQLVPLLVGLGLEARTSRLADRLLPVARRVSDVTFVFLLVLLLAVYHGEMLSLVGTGALFVSVIVTVAALLLGYSLGGAGRETREVLATTTAVRNAAIALFIATTSFVDPDVLTTVLAFSFVGVVISGLLAGGWRRRTGRRRVPS
ncbi:bile acid:sodium symporter family protein [Natrononativus amylolyticus]|uniref:bile acid:sodium symporter family protein n=1 Tax=Natrononativus amylolyticus TaxID=2963434 RepID=UPI0020CC6B94|nr:bile acid:sodium symporter [Natrononativus amylolyticus]